MEITLEKIELVKDRTGVTYREAKEALEAADGNVVDAIISIEEKVDEGTDKNIGAQGEALVAKMKEIVKKGNVAKIMVTRNGDTILNIPLNVGILGTVVAPWGMIAGVVVAFGFKCKIEFVKDDGSIIDITEKAGDFYEDAKEKSSDFYEDIKDKAPGVYEDLKGKAPDFYEDMKDKADDAFSKAKDVTNKAKSKFAKEKDDDDDDVNVDDINICDKDCEKCEDPCEERCDDCKYDEFHPENN
jgi:Transcription factor homologous to NACalpha-BTF3